MKAKVDYHSLKFFSKIQPKNKFNNIFTYFFIIFKVLPIFIITHDWNLFHSNGISGYILEFTLAPSIHRLQCIPFNIIILSLLFFLSIIPTIKLLIFYRKWNKTSIYYSTHKRLFNFLVLLLYIFPFLLSQFIYYICIENYYIKVINSSTSEYLFLTISIIQCIFIIFTLILSYFLSIIWIGPFYSTGEILVSNLKSVDFKWIYFSICQGIIQLEYYIKFNYMTYIKIIVRIIYILLFIYFLGNLKHSYFSKNNIVNLILIMCFFSSIIEFIALYDFKNDLVVLTSSVSIIIPKLTMEIILSVILMFIVEYNEGQRILDFFDDDFKSKNDIKEKGVLFPIFSKIIVQCTNIKYEKRNLHKIVHILNKFQLFFIQHKKNCVNNNNNNNNSNNNNHHHHINECFCIKYRIEKIKSCFKTFIDNNSEKPHKTVFSLKDFCPALYDFIEYYLHNILSKNGIQTGELLLLFLLFYLQCNENINQCFYYLDKYILTSQYKSSIIIEFQIENIKKFLKKKHKESNVNSTDIEYNQSKIKFKNMMSFLDIETLVKNSFDSYYDFLCKISGNEVTKDFFDVQIHKITKKLEDNEKIINHKIEGYKDSNYNKCFNFQFCSKLSIYYQFFYGKIPDRFKISFEPLTTLLNLGNFHPQEYIILIDLNSSKTNAITIEYLSDAFLIELGYSTHNSLKIKTLSDIIFPNFSSYYEEYLINEFLKGKSIISIPFILLNDKHNYTQVYHFNAIVIISDRKVNLFGKFKRSNKTNSCYALLNNMGYIIGISKEFSNTFYLNINIIKKLNVNLYNYFLKKNFDEDSLKRTFPVDTLQFYENISILNSNMMFENNQEEYASIYQSAKDAIAKIKKTSNSNSISTLEINLMPFSLTEETDSDFLFIAYFSVKNKTSIALLTKVINEGMIKKQNYKPPFVHTSSILSSAVSQNDKKVGMENKPLLRLSKDRGDFIEKLELIKEQSYNASHFIYGTSLNVLNAMRLHFANTHLREDKFDKSFHLSYRDNLIINSLYFQMYLFIGFFCLFIAFLVFIISYKNFLFSNSLLLSETELYVIAAKKIYNSVQTSVFGMQIKKNNLEDEKVDEFEYDYDSYVKLLNFRTYDYLENFKKFREKFYSNKFQSIKSTHILLPILLNSINIKTLSKNYTHSMTYSSLYDMFNFLHIKLNKLANGNLNPLSFNNSESYYIKGVTNDKGYDATEISPDSISVFILENGLTNMNYALIEVINIFEEIIANSIEHAERIILILNMVNAVIILIILVYQFIFYYRLSNKLFVKGFLNICNLKYFIIILLNKVKLLKSVMDIGTFDSIIALSFTKIKIANSKEESTFIESVTKNIEEDFQFHIFPFQCEKEIKEPNIKGSVSLKSLVAHAKLLSETNLMKPSTIKPQLFQLQEEKKKQSYAKNISRKNIFGKFKSSDVLTNVNVNSENVSTNANNVTNDSLILHQKTQSNQIKEKKIVKKIHNYNKIIIMISFVIIICGLSTINYFLSINHFTLLSKYSKIQTATLLRTNYFHEIILIFQLIILKNQPIFFEYKSTGYLNFRKEGKYLNDIQTHEILNETLHRYEIISEVYEDYISEDYSKAFQKNLIQLEQKMRRDDSCETVIEFFYNNKDLLNIPIFKSLEGFSIEELINNCKSIGKGYNLKGARNAFIGLKSYIADIYKDFKANKNRTEEYNYKIFQDKMVQIYQMETDRLLELIFFNYQIALKMDYNKKFYSLSLLESSFFIVMIILLSMIAILYLYHFTLYFMKMDISAEKVNEFVHNTIMY